MTAPTDLSHLRDLPDATLTRSEVRILCDEVDGLSPAAVNAEATHCVNGHEFTEANTYRRPDKGARCCRRCKADREAARRLERAS